jgi:hypothetical protein
LEEGKNICAAMANHQKFLNLEGGGKTWKMALVKAAITEEKS